jgi:chromosomal replication initiation ATPase DnaA
MSEDRRADPWARREISRLQHEVAMLRELLTGRKAPRADACQVIADIVGNHHGTTGATLLSRERVRELHEVRRIAIYLCRRVTGLSYPALGRVWGRDQTTMHQAVQEVGSARDANRPLARKLAALEAECKAALEARATSPTLVEGETSCV